MGKLNSFIKFVVFNVNALLFLGGIGIIVVASLVLTADFIKLAEVSAGICAHIPTVGVSPAVATIINRGDYIACSAIRLRWDVQQLGRVWFTIVVYSCQTISRTTHRHACGKLETTLTLIVRRTTMFISPLRNCPPAMNVSFRQTNRRPTCRLEE